MALDATPLGASADSYVDVAFANAYFKNRLHVDVWDNLGTSEKEKALKWATQVLDRLQWLGSKVGDVQALRNPRSYMDDLDGDWFDDTLMQPFLEQATCELAMSMAEADRTTDEGSDQLKSLAVGPIKLAFNDKYVKEIMTETVKDIIRPFLSSLSNDWSSMRLLRA